MSRDKKLVRGWICVLLGSATMTSDVTAQQEPVPVRHGLSQAGTEFLVLRHQQLKPGTHETYLKASQDGVWPFYEKLGNRNVGQWQVVYPQGGKPAGDDEGYRIARYRSFNHWAATRRAVELGGNGPDWEAAQEALAIRRSVTTGSDGPLYLEGEMAPSVPYYFPLSGRATEGPTASPRCILCATVATSRVKKSSHCGASGSKRGASKRSAD